MLHDPYVQKAQSIIRPLLQHGDRLFLFGSRTTTRHHPYSDIDLGIESQQPLPSNLLTKITDMLEESDLPVRVDVVDFSNVSEAFKRIATSSMQPL